MAFYWESSGLSFGILNLIKIEKVPKDSGSRMICPTSFGAGQVTHNHPWDMDSHGLGLLGLLHSALGAGGRESDSPKPGQILSLCTAYT